MGPLGRCLMESGASNPGVAIVTRPAVDRPHADPVAPATSCRIRNPLPDLSESSVFGPMTHPHRSSPSPRGDRRRHPVARATATHAILVAPGSLRHLHRGHAPHQCRRPAGLATGRSALSGPCSSGALHPSGEPASPASGDRCSPFRIRKGEHHVRSNNDKHRASDRRAARRHRPETADLLPDPHARRAASRVARAGAAHAARCSRQCERGGRSP